MINIAIDGPSGAGKSTVAKAIAKELGIIYLDTGAMYRATAYYALSRGVDVNDVERVQEILPDLNMDIRYQDGVQQIYVGEVNATPFLREHHMSKAASDISAHPCVRYKMVDLQRQFAKEHDVVLDGRDIGTFVLPDANCKIYLDADPAQRARRRYDELEQRGEHIEFEQLLEDIKKRDFNDANREVAPLRRAEDAVYIDTTSMSVEQVLDEVKKVVLSVSNSEKKQDTPKQNAQNAAKGYEVDEETGLIKKPPVKDKTKRFKQETSFRFYRFLGALLRPLQKVLWPTKIVNRHYSDELEGGLYICNHYTKVDSLIPCFNLFKKEAHVLAKYELFKVSIAGWFLTKMGGIPVRRGDADIEAARTVLKVLKAKKKLLIFPEGTRNKAGTQQLAELKDGTARFAIKTKTPIVPMIYYAPPKLFKKNWLYIGEPFTLEEFYGARTQEDFKRATAVVTQKMQQTRELCNQVAQQSKAKKSKKAKKDKNEG